MSQMVYLKGVVTLRLDEAKCVGCGMCLFVCPHAVLRPINGRVEIGNRDACMECGACSQNCPVKAVSVRAGVGCAAAVINSALGRKSSCCCTIEPEDASGGANEGAAGTDSASCC